MDRCLKFSAFGRMIAGYRLAVLLGKDEREGSNNPNISCSLVDFVASLDKEQDCLRTATVLRNMKDHAKRGFGILAGSDQCGRQEHKVCGHPGR